MGVTDKWALPYPEADTLISVSAPIVQELAEKIDAALSGVMASDSYIIPGTLISNYTASGTFTPPAGVTLVHVAVISGGGQGGDRGFAGSTEYCNGAGGTGGGVRVYRDVPVTGPVAVTIGGSMTASSFGALTAPAGRTPGTATWTPDSLNGSIPAQSPNFDASAGGGLILGSWNNTVLYALGQDGVQINGTHYAGGGGGGGGHPQYNNVGAGGAGGGGKGGTRQDALPAAGTNGLGGGGGGKSHTTGNGSGGLGGSGRVMIWTEQTTRDTPPAAIDPVIVAALNDGVMVGAYAVDPVAPVDTLGVLVPFPDEPQPTGEEWTDEETGETGPVLAWPEAGWTYIDGEWSPPND
jgi:hypothetical protein